MNFFKARQETRFLCKIKHKEPESPDEGVDYMKKIFLLILLIFLSANVSLADTFTVSKTDDTSDGVCDSDCSLREAVIAANASDGDDAIELSEDTYTFTLSGRGEDSAATGDLDITDYGDTLTINGNNAVVDGDDLDRIFHVLSTGVNNEDISVLVLNDITLQNTQTGGDGGIILNEGTLTVNNSTIQNAATGSQHSGGGIYSDNGVATINDSFIINNDADRYGGGVASNGGTLIIDNSTIKGNTNSYPSSSDGGGIALLNTATGVNATITNSNISNNKAKGGVNSSGGAMYVEGHSTLTISNCTFSNNKAKLDGGAFVFTGSPDVYIYNSTISNNYADSDDSTTGAGGAITHLSTGTVYLKGTIISDNYIGSGGTVEENCYLDEFSSGSITSGDYNIDSGATCTLDSDNDQENTDPLLDATGLTDNGGDTETISLQTSPSVSPAINKIPSNTCQDHNGSLTEDQRGETRIGYCDIGAYEYQDSVDPVITITNDTSDYNTLECNVDSWTDPGATALDDIDSSLTAYISTLDGVNISIVDSYSVTYSVDDFSTNDTSETRTVSVEDTTLPTITITNDTEDYNVLECGIDSWSDPGATASDLCDTSITTASTTDSVDTSVIDDYSISYNVTDAEGNYATSTRTVTVQDTTSPIITITKNTSDYNILECGIDIWIDPGATASDACDSSVSASTTDTVDTSLVDDYLITYTATDGAANPATSIRTVSVEDSTIPTITLIGEEEVSVNENETYTDAGANVNDSCDSTITLSTNNPVDVSTPGIYTITYTATDASGNEAISKTRAVTVIATPEEEIPNEDDEPEDSPEQDTPDESDEEPEEGATEDDTEDEEVEQQDAEQEINYTPKKVKSLKVSKRYKKKVKLKWKKYKKNTSGYIIQVYRKKKNKKYKKIRTIRLKKNKAVKLVKKLKVNTSYKFRVRAYYKNSGITYKGKWSKYKKFKTKK